MPDDKVSSLAGLEGFAAGFERLLPSLGLRRPRPDSVVIDRLAAFCELMLRWNASLNLTGSRSLPDLVEEHLPDALVLADEVPEGVGVVDVGAGGGLPGLPLALLRPDLSLHCLEPRHKRVAFLRTAVRELGMRGVTVSPVRVEDWAAPQGGVQVAVSRATFGPEVWVPMGRGLVNPGGLVFAFLSESERRGPTPDEERSYPLPRGQVRRLGTYRA